jgi:hypothetical protein
VGHLFNAKQVAEAKSLAEEIIQTGMPAASKVMGERLGQTGLEFAAVLNRHEANDLAIKALASTALEPCGKTVELLARYLMDQRFDESRWDADPRFLSARHQAQYFTGVAIGIINEAGVAALSSSETLRRAAAIVQVWMDRIGFHDVDERDEAPLRYAVAARWYEAMLGTERFISMLEGVAMPTAPNHDHANRTGGLAQLSLDLPWIRASVPYWYGKLAALFHRDKKELDRRQFDQLVQRIAEGAGARAPPGGG